MAIYFTQNTNNVEDIEQMNNVIDKVNKVNTEATSNIGQLTDLNTKAEELSDNINKGLPLNSELVKNTEEAKAANTNLLEANQEATTKNTELQASLEKTKEFIEGLDGSQNIPQIRLDVDALQNGLKSNQALSYEGSSIAANNTLEGRTEGMRIGGRTLVNLKGNVKNRVSTWVDNDDKYTLNLESGHGQPSILYNLTHVLKENQKYTVIVNLVEYTSGVLHFSFMNSEGNKLASTTELVAESKGLKKFVFTTNSTINAETLRILPRNGINNIYSISKNILILEGDWTNKDVPSYFEGIESFGEQEGNKISILSNGKNLTNCKFELGIWNVSPTDQEPNKQSNSNYVRSSELIDISKFNDQQISISLNGKSVEGNIKYYTKDRKYIKDVFNAPFNPVPNAFYITIHVPLSRFSKYDEFQIETGSNSTSYEPYKCDKKDILIKEPLRGLDENTCDIMYEDNGQVKVDRKLSEYTFTGDENWQLSSELQDELICFYIFFPLTTATTPILCNNFIQKPTMEKGIECITNNGGGNSTVRIKINKSKLTTPDLEGFKSWLKTNQTTVVYQLATPVTEVVENCVDIDLDTYQEKTYFSIENSLPGTLDFKVPSNIASIVQNTAREVNNIWDVINNLLVPSLIDINKNVAMSTIKNNLK